jgi:hypothetical protein
MSGHTQKHYQGNNGSLYKFAEDEKLQRFPLYKPYEPYIFFLLYKKIKRDKKRCHL